MDYTPLVYFGAKRKAAPLIWRLFGRVRSYVDPFMGSLSVPLACPYEIPRVVVNDLNCLLVNFWRALQRDPEAVAYWAEYPSSHVDLMARREWLRQQWPTAVQCMQNDPEWHDPRMAGWYVWVISNVIAGHWEYLRTETDDHDAYAQVLAASRRYRLDWDTPPSAVPADIPRATRKHSMPHTSEPQGVQLRRTHAVERDVPVLTGMKLRTWMCDLAERIQEWIILHSSWRPIVSSRVILRIVPSETRYTALLLDPPYDAGKIPRTPLYVEDTMDVAAEVREWLFTPNEKDGIIPWYHPRLRIILCAYEGDHHPLPDSRTYRWSDRSDAHNMISDHRRRPAKREILIANPACLDPDAARQESLF